MIGSNAGSRIRDITTLRYRGWMGGHITPHRAFRKLWLSPADICVGVILTLGATAGWVVLLPRVARLWARLLSFWIKRLWAGGPVVLVDSKVLGHFRVPVPWFPVKAGPVTGWIWFSIAAGSLLLFAFSYKLSRDNSLPFIYLIRALCMIQWSALAYVGLRGRQIPQDPSEYCSSMLLFGMILIAVMPGVLAVSFYIFDVSSLKKIALTAMIMAHLTLFIPLQYLLHACILRVSLLFLPILYFVLGPLLDVIVFIAFYSWGMSWSSSRRFPGPAPKTCPPPDAAPLAHVS